MRVCRVLAPRPSMPTIRTMSRRAWIIFILVWLLLLAGAFGVDQPVKQWLYDHQFHDEVVRVFKGTWWAKAVKSLGHIRTVAAIAAILVVTGRLYWRRAAVLLVCASTAILSDVVKWLAGRQRPIAEDGSLTGPFDFVPFTVRPAGVAFVSGHTMLAFATATAIARYYPRWALPAYFLASLVAAERVLEVAHHVSDVVAAAGLGVFVSILCMNLLAKWAASPADKIQQKATAQ